MNLELQDPNADEPKDDQSLVESNTEEQDLLWWIIVPIHLWKNIVQRYKIKGAHKSVNQSHIYNSIWVNQDCIKWSYMAMQGEPNDQIDIY